MGLLSRFDLSSDFTQFFLGGLILLMTFVILLSWVSPKNKDVKRRRRGGKVDDRFVSSEGELID
jgi:hypothetical protein